MTAARAFYCFPFLRLRLFLSRGSPSAGDPTVRIQNITLPFDVFTVRPYSVPRFSLAIPFDSLRLRKPRRPPSHRGPFRTAAAMVVLAFLWRFWRVLRKSPPRDLRLAWTSLFLSISRRAAACQSSNPIGMGSRCKMTQCSRFGRPLLKHFEGSMRCLFPSRLA